MLFADRHTAVLQQLYDAIAAAAPKKAPPPPPKAAAVDSEPAAATEPAAAPAAAAPSRKRARAEEPAVVEVEDSSAAASFDMKREILRLLSSSDGGRVKAKRLRKFCVDGGVRGGAPEADAEAAFDKRLAKMEKRGVCVSDPSGKFVLLCPTPPAAGDDD